MPDKNVDDDDFTIPPPTSNRSPLLLFTPPLDPIAEISGDQIIIRRPGSTVITARQDSNRRFNTGSISTIFNVIDNDCDSDGIGDFYDPDDDNDGISDEKELLYGTDICGFDLDTDGDGIPIQLMMTTIMTAVPMKKIFIHVIPLSVMTTPIKMAY